MEIPRQMYENSAETATGNSAENKQKCQLQFSRKVCKFKNISMEIAVGNSANIPAGI